MTFFRNFGQRILYPVNGINTRPIEITNFFRYIRAIPEYLDNVISFQKHTIRDGERPDQISYELYGTPDYHWTFFIINDSLKDSGMSAWPLGYNDLQKLIAKKYPGSAFETNPSVILDGAGSPTSFPDSVAGQFDLIEPIPPSSGSNSLIETEFLNGFRGPLTGNTAKIIGKKIELQQIIYKLISPSFNFSSGNIIEQIPFGMLSTDPKDSVVISKVYSKFEDAPHHFVDSNGIERVNNKFISGGGFGALTPITNREWEYERNESNRLIKVIDKRFIKNFDDAFRELIRNDIGVNRL